MEPALLVLLLAAAAAVHIDVADIDVDLAVQLEAGAAAGGGQPRRLTLEPGEPLALAQALCPANPSPVLAQGAALLQGALGAAARAGRALLLTSPSPPRTAFSALHLYPHEDALAGAAVALIAEKGWQKAVLLHDGSSARAALIAPDDELFELAARILPPPEAEEAILRNLLLVLKKESANQFIVWCDAECSERVLATAQRVGLLADKHAYILLSLDMHTRDLDAFSHGGANITALQLSEITNVGDEEDDDYERQPQDKNDSDVSSAQALAATGARCAAAAVRHLFMSDSVPDDTCEWCASALHADTVLNYIRSSEWPAEWDADGGRRSLRLTVSELARGGALRPVGMWSGAGSVQWARPEPPAAPPASDLMTNRTFIVLIAKSKPYVMFRESAERLSGNARYEGFCIELIEKLSEILHFNYTFLEQLDGEYGKLDSSTNEWGGMMGWLLRDPDVHFAITDLTITAEREQAVDFTTPFMNLGISILFRTPKEPEPRVFAFLLPFSTGVWLWLGVAYVATSLILYVVGRLCPEEWQNPYPCVEEPEALENQFTLANALWFNLGAVLLQGSEIAPLAYGSRAVASVWWVFALVITSSYTANLATLLAKKSSDNLIRTVEDLAHNTLGITYGAKENGSTYTFFEDSQNKLYQEMYEHMKVRKMPKTNDQGIEKVMKSPFAFLMESTTIEYTTERNCEVTQVGKLLDNKGYGIAMKKNSPYRQSLNLALLNLQEAGVLREMKTKWWNEMHGGGACKKVEEKGSEPLEMKNFLGLFFVLVGGSALGLVVSFAQLTWRARRDWPRYGRRLAADLRFVFDLERTEKPLQSPPLSETPPPSPPESPPPTPRRPSQRSRRRSSIAEASARLVRHTSRDRWSGSGLHRDM